MKLEKPKLGILCQTCGAVLVSWHRRDFKLCDCGNFIDGGDDYFRCGGDFANMQTIKLSPLKEKKNATRTKTKKS